MTITSTEVQQLLDTYGLSVPSFVLDAAIEKANGVEACLVGAGHSAAEIKLIQAYAAVLIAGGGDARKIKSQGAPNGASRSFDYGTKGLTALRTTLQGLDKAGCTADIIGPDPLSNSFFGVFTGES